MEFTLRHLTFILAIIISGTVSGDIQPIPVTVQEGNQVILEIKEKAPFYDFFWLKNNEDTVVLYDSINVEIYPAYKNRVDFNEQTLSITIRNMQKTDSGLYTAKASEKTQKIIGSYNVTVERARSHGSTAEIASVTWLTFLFLLSVIYLPTL
ncbi:SLAM family member 9-like [Puntigrus tetrazona]|uniref:SLAM family member 9-like n=1 Tax=Puntigrus tetrazona TaxID=1606681 RepID=UPI001C88F785|nr:SLAM family member 9-like [Puntigrus tetrazona]